MEQIKGRKKNKKNKTNYLKMKNEIANHWTSVKEKKWLR